MLRVLTGMLLIAAGIGGQWPLWAHIFITAAGIVCIAIPENTHSRNGN